MKSTIGNEKRFVEDIVEPITNLKSHIGGRKYIWKRTLHFTQQYTVYKTSKLKFLMNVSFDTPVRLNSPAVSVLFMQTEPYSWVDIAVYIKPVPHTNKPFLKQAYLAGSIHLANSSDINSKQVGSIVDNMCIINFDARKSKKENAQFAIAMKTRSLDRHTDNTGLVSRFPLRSTFNATLNLSKLSPDFILKLQGYPLELAISNLADTSYVLNVFWVSDQTHANEMRCAERRCHICVHRIK